MKPILMNTEMVRAILDGRKTVTRRVIGKDISNAFDCEYNGTAITYIDKKTGDHFRATAPCKYQRGDVLWVRETWFRSECTPECAGWSDKDECPFNRVGSSC